MFCVKFANRRHRSSAIYLQKKLFESKNFTIATVLKIIMLDHQNNYIDNAAKNLDILAISLSMLHNYKRVDWTLYFFSP